MKQFLLKILALLCVMLLGGGDVWGESFLGTYSYGSLGSTWTLTNYSDKVEYYLVPYSKSLVSIATISNVFSNKTITSDIKISIHGATYGSGTNPTANTFSIYNSSDCTTAIVATQGGVLPYTGVDYSDVTYTINQSNATPLTKDLVIKISCGSGESQIRLKSIKVSFSYSISGETTTHNAIFSVNGHTYSMEYNEGSAIAFNDPTENIPEGKTFVGWTTDPLVGTSSTAPTFITSAVMGSADVTYYAVFAKENQEGQKWEKITSANDVTAGTYAIISYDGSYYLPNAVATSSCPAAKTVALTNGVIDVAEDMKWNLKMSGSNINLISCANTNANLWGGSSSDATRVDASVTVSGATNDWAVKNNDTYGIVLYTTANLMDRYLNVSDSKDWKLYVSGNVTDKVANLYKLTDGMSYSDYCTVAPYSRSTALGKYGTICLPYNFTVEGARLYTVAAVNDNSITLDEGGSDDCTAGTAGTAGVPYIYKANTSDGQTFTYRGGDFVTTPVAGAQGLTGVFEKTAVAAGDYVMQTQDNVQGFYVVSDETNTVYSSEYKCYLAVASRSSKLPGKAYKIVAE